MNKKVFEQLVEVALPPGTLEMIEEVEQEQDLLELLCDIGDNIAAADRVVQQFPENINYFK